MRFIKPMAVTRRKFLTGASAVGAGSLLGPQLKTQVRAAEPEKFRILLATVPPDPAYHYHFYALENGFYAKHGLNVEIKPIQSETTTMRALIAGEGDIAAALSPLSALQAVDAGAKLKCVTSFTPKLDYLLIGNKDITDLKQLEDRLFGVTQVGTISQLVPSLMIKQAGGDPAKVRWVSVGNSSARLQATIAKRVDAAAVNASLARKALTYDYLRVIASAAETLPDFLYGWDITTQNIFNKKPSAFKAYADATSEGIRWGLNNPDKAVAISQRVLPDLAGSEVEAAINAFIAKKFWNESGILPMATWNYTTKTLLDIGQIKTVPKYSEFVDG